MIPSSLALILLAVQYAWIPPIRKAGILLSLLLLCTCVWAKHCRGHFRFPPLLLLTLTGALWLFLQPKGSRLSYVQNHWGYLASAGIAAGVFVIVSILTRTTATRRLLLAVLTALLPAALFCRIEIEKNLFALWLLPLLAALSEEVQHSWKKSGTTSRQQHLVSIAPFLILTCLLVTAFPAPEKPFDWSFTTRIWNQAVDFIARIENTITGHDDYDGKIGFSEKSGFLGKVAKTGTKEMLSVSFGVYSGNTMYLRGKTFDRFDGSEWTNTLENSEALRETELTEKNEHIMHEAPEDTDVYMRKSEAEITYLDFRTKYVFVPLDGSAYYTVPENLKIKNEGAALTASRQLGQNTRYHVGFYRMNQDSGEFRKFVKELSARHSGALFAPEKTVTPENETGKETQDNPKNSDPMDPSGYQRIITEKYLPQTQISGQTRALLLREMKSLPSDYERLEHLEEILSSMKYSLSPGKIPDSVHTPADYLDYFLFQSRKGYCVHYATAFVLLARSMGIPARYVQGYYIRRGKNGPTIVTGNMAHAWPEAYIRGFGWLSFEPTPGKKKTSYWVSPALRGNSSSPQDYDHRPSGQTDEDGANTQTLTEKKDSPSKPFPWRRVADPVLHGTCILLLLAIFRCFLSRRHYQKSSAGNRFRLTCAKNEKLLSYLGCRRKPEETLQEFQTRITEKYPASTVTFLRGMENVYYGGKNIDADMAAEAEQNRQQLWKQIRIELGSIRYFFLRALNDFL
jgi:transglutaminase-like putative cysteine protease